MLKRFLSALAVLGLIAVSSPVLADPYAETIKVFQNAGESGKFFKTAYGYAVFPTIGKAGFVVGGAYGEGRVFVRGKHVGDTTMTQASIGFQLGAEGFSQIVFFENEAAFKEFSKGNFEFGADAQAVAIVLAAGAKANTAGSGATASATQDKAGTASAGYRKGMAVFTVIKGGLMYEASVSGQKFSYKPVK